MALGGIVGAAIMSLVTPERSAVKYKPFAMLQLGLGAIRVYFGCMKELV